MSGLAGEEPEVKSSASLMKLDITLKEAYSAFENPPDVKTIAKKFEWV